MVVCVIDIVFSVTANFTNYEISHKSEAKEND